MLTKLLMAFNSKGAPIFLLGQTLAAAACREDWPAGIDRGPVGPVWPALAAAGRGPVFSHRGCFNLQRQRPCAVQLPRDPCSRDANVVDLLPGLPHEICLT